MICADYLPEFASAENSGGLIKTADGETNIYDYQTSKTFTVGQFDFSSPAGVTAATADAGKPLARFARSGWTGSASLPRMPHWARTRTGAKNSPVS